MTAAEGLQLSPSGFAALVRKVPRTLQVAAIPLSLHSSPSFFFI